MDVDILLKKYGLKYEELNPVERETFNQMVASIQQGQITPERMRDYINDMRESLLIEVSNYSNGSTQDLFVKARIRNYTLLLAFLGSPEKAKAALERSLAGVGK